MSKESVFNDRDARFARLVQSNRQAITRYAMRRLEELEDVEDLVADTCVVAWRHIDEAHVPDEQIYWLYGIARRVLSNTTRGHTRSLRLESRLAHERERTTGEPRFDSDDLAQLLDALGALSPDERELIQLAYWERLSYRDIGLVLECNEKAAGVRLSRAKSHLSQLIDQTSDGVVSLARRPEGNKS